MGDQGKSAKQIPMLAIINNKIYITTQQNAIIKRGHNVLEQTNNISTLEDGIIFSLIFYFYLFLLLLFFINNLAF